MKKEFENKNELVTYEDICKEAFEPSIALMMKKYDVLSMTNLQLGNAYQEVRDAVEDGSEEFMGTYFKVIKKLLRKYKKLGQFDLSTEPKTEEEKSKIVEQNLSDMKTRNGSSIDKEISLY